jgi:uncharacterized membrane protein YkvI
MQIIAVALLITSCFFLLHYIGHTFSRILHRNPNPVAVVARMIFYFMMSAIFVIFFLAFLDYMQIDWRQGWPWAFLYIGFFIASFLLDKAILRKVLERMDPRLSQTPRERIKISRY